MYVTAIQSKTLKIGTNITKKGTLNKENISFKGATKLYFMHYSCVVIILFNTVYVGLHFLQFLLEN